jgi:nucleoside phosphorylase
LGNVHGFSVSIASVRTPAKGQLPAQETARNVIEDLDPAWIAVVGICGAVPDSEFTLGDVIVASRLHAFTIGAVDEGEPVHFSDVGGPLRRQAEDLVGYIRALGSDLSGWDADQMIGYPRPDVSLAPKNFYGSDKRRRETKKIFTGHFAGQTVRSRPVVTTRPVGSSDFLLKDTATLEGWLKSARDLSGIEMELAGIYEAARRRDRDYPVLAIRGISDVVGFKRSGDWTRYACETAASLFSALVRVMPEHFLRGNPPRTTHASTPAVMGRAKPSPDPIARRVLPETTPVILWTLPRGFILLDDLQRIESEDWATTAHYYNYQGQNLGSTHYHESYGWCPKARAFDVQCRKLGVPPGDRYLAYGALRLMVDIREGYRAMSPQGKLLEHGSEVTLPPEATAHAPGDVPMPSLPGELCGELASGPLRDLAAEADDVLDELRDALLPSCRPFPELVQRAARIRRESRLTVHEILGERHPATKNLEEIVVRKAMETRSDLIGWLEELRDALFEAARSVEVSARQT